ncbi:DUF4397 domain-containing protein [Pedobacter petrophilus]|uniref:DUF4397 domain-containing protein n=1 Tax=Pedobacter petrophilus TaxID=1908241 RepID=A0A7K0FZ24_9SPHI|nr:DUF4397 domain-containing protein [Pedobacter petrophilus]MRX76229.1 DUF4397 domain-containing protein [Pedobacter petrophilus]
MMMFTLKKFKCYSFLALSLLIGLNACKKQEAVDSTLSNFRVINMAPTLGTYNVYLNGSALTTAALPYVGSTAYSTQNAGSYALKFTSGNSAESLLTKTVTLSASVYQSFYLINKPGALDVLAITDDLGVPSTDKAYVRLINLSPDASAFDLAKTNATTSLTTNKTFKTTSGFIAIDPGTFTLDLKETAGGTVKAVSESTTFTAGYHYDVIAGGLITPANDTERPLSLRVLQIK